MRRHKCVFNQPRINTIFMLNRTLYSFLNNFLNFLPPYGIALDIRGYLASKALNRCGRRLRISSNVNIYNPQFIAIGNDVYIGYNTYIGGGNIIFDDEVIIGPFCSIVAGNHTKRNGSYRYGEYEFGTISIGRGTWLGAHVNILSNVKIGNGCCVAAGSVVTGDIEDYAVYGGVPARRLNNTNLKHS